MNEVEFTRENVFLFLEAVRETGSINMFGAAPYIQEEFNCTRKEAKDLLLDWMQNRSSDS
jgi:hypothetical protein